MLSGIEYGSVIESSTHIIIRVGRQGTLARNVVIVDFDPLGARNASVVADLAWWQQLRNRHLVEIISAARAGEGLTLVLDQADCVTIGSAPPLSRPAQALLVCHILEALSVIHDAGRAHGYVGVDSILVDATGLARLGLPGLSMANAAFRAPELNGPQRTPPGDLYSAGRVLERLAGQQTQLWEPIISQATAVEPADRYPSARGMRTAIDSLMTEEEGRDWVAVGLSGLAAAATTLLVVGATSGAASTLGSITVAGMSANSALPPPLASASPPPPPPPSPLATPVTIPAPPPPPAALVQLRVGGALRRIRRARWLAGGVGSVAVLAVVVTGLVIFSRGNSTPSAAPTTTVQPGSTSSSPPPTPPTTIAATTATTVAPPAAFDALPAPISAAPSSWVWTAPVGSTLAGSAFAADGVVIAVIVDQTGNTPTAVGIRDGVEIWRHSFPTHTGDFPALPPSVVATADSAIVAYDLPQAATGAAPDLGLTSLNAADGSERWSQRFANAFGGHPRRGPGNIILVGSFLADDGQIAAVDSTDGHLLWDRDTANVLGVATAIRDDRAVITYWRDNATNVVDIRTGQVLYEVNGQASALAEPVLYTMTGGFGCDPTCVLQGNDASTGALLWTDSDQTGVLLGVTSDGAAIMQSIDPADASGRGPVEAIEPTGTQRWADQDCTNDATVTPVDVGLLLYCTDQLTLVDNRTGAGIQQLTWDANASSALAANETLYTLVQSRVTATTIGPGAASLWSVELPGGVAAASPEGDPPRITGAFDHGLFISGHAADGRAALAVLTDAALAPPTEPALTLDDLIGGADVVGHVGPYAMPDGTRTMVVTHGDPTAQSDAPADVELAVERTDGWHIVQIIELGSVGVPLEVGDVTGDGRSEIDIPSPTPIGGKSTETLYRIDDSGPALIAFPFDIEGKGTGATSNALQITSASVDHVTALVNLCDPTCELATPTSVDFVLDRTGTWSLVPTQPIPPPAALPGPTVCIRSNIDFAALRDAPDLNANLLGQIPPGSCDVSLVDTETVQGNGFAWYHVLWNGIDGWTAKSNTA